MQVGCQRRKRSIMTRVVVADDKCCTCVPRHDVRVLPAESMLSNARSSATHWPVLASSCLGKQVCPDSVESSFCGRYAELCRASAHHTCNTKPAKALLHGPSLRSNDAGTQMLRLQVASGDILLYQGRHVTLCSLSTLCAQYLLCRDDWPLNLGAGAQCAKCNSLLV